MSTIKYGNLKKKGKFKYESFFCEIEGNVFRVSKAKGSEIKEKMEITHNSVIRRSKKHPENFRVQENETTQPWKLKASTNGLREQFVKILEKIKEQKSLDNAEWKENLLNRRYSLRPKANTSTNTNIDPINVQSTTSNSSSRRESSFRKRMIDAQNFAAVNKQKAPPPSNIVPPPKPSKHRSRKSIPVSSTPPELSPPSRLPVGSGFREPSTPLSSNTGTISPLKKVRRIHSSFPQTPSLSTSPIQSTSNHNPSQTPLKMSHSLNPPSSNAYPSTPSLSATPTNRNKNTPTNRSGSIPISTSLNTNSSTPSSSSSSFRTPHSSQRDGHRISNPGLEALRTPLDLSRTMPARGSGSRISKHSRVGSDTLRNSQNRHDPNMFCTPLKTNPSRQDLPMVTPREQRTDFTQEAGGRTGLSNLGNTCFMNSAVQCLVHCRHLVDYFLRNKYRIELNKNNPLGCGGKLAIAFTSLIEQLWGTRKAVAPRNFLRTIAVFAPQFAGYRQHDSQEFIAYLLDGLHEDLNRCKEKPYIECREHDGTKDDSVIAAASWADHLKRNKSHVVDVFQGQLKSTVRCLKCGNTSVKFDPFMYLSLPLAQSRKKSVFRVLGSKGSILLEDCLRAFAEEETLDGDNQWYCGKCKSHRDAAKKLELWKLPPVLVVHFKRFRSDRRRFGRGSKRGDLVKFPVDDVIDMEQFMPSPQPHSKYRLFAVSNHMGSLSGGHYTACAAVPNGEVRSDGLPERDWFQFNDEWVSPCKDTNQICSSSAYVVMFERVELDAPTDYVVRRQSLSQPGHWPHGIDAVRQSLPLLRTPSSKGTFSPDDPLMTPREK